MISEEVATELTAEISHSWLIEEIGADVWTTAANGDTVYKPAAQERFNEIYEIVNSKVQEVTA